MGPMQLHGLHAPNAGPVRGWSLGGHSCERFKFIVKRNRDNARWFDQPALMVHLSGSCWRETNSGVRVRAMAGIFHPFVSLCFQFIHVPGSI